MTDFEDDALAEFVDYLRAQFRQAAGSYSSLVDLEARLIAVREIVKGREGHATGRERIHDEGSQDSVMDRDS